MMLLNLSNHPSPTWPENQAQLAKDLFGEIRDLPFPQVDPEADESEIAALADAYFDKIRGLNPSAVHLMGELTFSFELVQKLKSHGIRVLASTTHRTTQEMPDGTKISRFEFVRFRYY
jgi:hypothetical protein